MSSDQSRWSIYTKTEDGGRNWNGDIVKFLVTPATKSKPRGQKGTVKMSGCNRLWPVCAADATGPISRDAGEQSAGAPPRRRGVVLPPRGRKGRHGEECLWRLPMGKDQSTGSGGSQRDFLSPWWATMTDYVPVGIMADAGADGHWNARP
jgi:hypothetical protein